MSFPLPTASLTTVFASSPIFDHHTLGQSALWQPLPPSACLHRRPEARAIAFSQPAKGIEWQSPVQKAI